MKLDLGTNFNQPLFTKLETNKLCSTMKLIKLDKLFSLTCMSEAFFIKSCLQKPYVGRIKPIMHLEIVKYYPLLMAPLM